MFQHAWLKVLAFALPSARGSVGRAIKEYEGWGTNEQMEINVVFLEKEKADNAAL